MRLSLFKSLWGVVSEDGGKQHAVRVLQGLRGAGYSGVECSVKLAYDIARRHPDFVRVFNDLRLEWIPVAFSSGPVWDPPWVPALEGHACPRNDAPPEAHVAALREQVQAALALGIERVPFVNAHAGHDSFSHQKSVDLFHLVQALAQGELGGLPIAHEIHRGRALCSPYTGAAILDACPGARVIADYSHFLAACECSPEDDVLNAALRRILPRVHHVHARVGYDQGAQVPDPRSPEWARHAAAHLRWWREIWAHQAAAGAPRATVTPETGPPPYQHTLPFSGGVPTADIDDVNAWLADEARREFQGALADAAAEARGAPPRD